MSGIDARDSRGVLIGDGNQYNAFIQGGTAPRPPDAGRAITDWDPFTLEIHRVVAIPASHPDLPPLPRYVLRPHDTDLRNALSDAQSTLIVASGGSSTGKSRALYEAVLAHRNLRTWPLLAPADAEHLLGWLEHGLLPERTVLWLSDLEHHLLSPKGEAVAAGLIGELTSTGRQTLMVGTLWPKSWRHLTRRPPRGVSETPATYRLLTHHARRVPIRPFDETSLKTLTLDDGNLDPRVREAARLSGPKRLVIQTLAGGPMLVDAYLDTNHDDPAQQYAKAVESVAIDAARLDLDRTLSRDFIISAAVAYLDPEDRANAPVEWVDVGLDLAAEPVRGIRALQPSASTPGTTDAYRLHDYLAYYAKEVSPERPVPESFWGALNLLVTGDRVAALRLAEHLKEQGANAEAIDILLPHVVATTMRDSGISMWPVIASNLLVGLLRAESRRDVLHQFLQDPPAGSARALTDWCYELRDRHGLERLADLANDKYVRKRLAWLLHDLGDRPALESLAERSHAATHFLTELQSDPGDSR